MFRIASDNKIDVYADSVSEFISKCISDVVPTVTIKTFPNQKPWIDGSIRAKLKEQTTALNQDKVTSRVALAVPPETLGARPGSATAGRDREVRRRPG